MELRPAEPGIESVYDCPKSTKVCIGLGLFVLGDHWLCVSSYHSFFCPYKSIEVDISFTVFCHKPNTARSIRLHNQDRQMPARRRPERGRQRRQCGEGLHAAQTKDQTKKRCRRL